MRARARRGVGVSERRLAALLAMFMRVGGGIFTKAADVGADLVGKVEKSIPEDDPRNAAVIADNVGDCAGMAADLFESFEVTLVASIVLGLAAFPDRPEVGLLFPLIVQAIGIVSSIVGIYLVRPRSEREGGMAAINRGFFASALISLVLVGVASLAYVQDWRPLAAVALGLALSSVIQLMTSYYTATQYKPVQEIAEASETGPATTILSGFAYGLEASVYAILAVVGAIIGAVLIGQPGDWVLLKAAGVNTMHRVLADCLPIIIQRGARLADPDQYEQLLADLPTLSGIGIDPNTEDERQVDGAEFWRSASIASQYTGRHGTDRLVGMIRGLIAKTSKTVTV